MQQSDMLIQSRLQAFCDSHGELSGNVTDVWRLSGGWETDVFAYDLQSGSETQHMVLRVYPCGESALLRAVNEAHVMKYLHTVGYPVPRVVAFEPDSSHLGGPFLIMERVGGIPLQSYLGERPELMARFAQLLFDLHHVDWRPLVGGKSPWPTEADAEATFSLHWLSGSIREYGLAEVFDPILTWLSDRNRQIVTRQAVIHGDYHPLNILLADEGAAAVIDWGSTAVADPRIDVANALLMAYVLGQPHLLPFILNGYETLAGEPLQDLDYFQALILTRRLSMMLIAMVHGDEACGMRPGTQAHLQQKVDVALAIYGFLQQLTGVSLPRLDPVLAQFG